MALPTFADIVTWAQEHVYHRPVKWKGLLGLSVQAKKGAVCRASG